MQDGGSDEWMTNDVAYSDGLQNWYPSRNTIRLI
jgi:hypothetical protein